jgi:hypothetical protein
MSDPDPEVQRHMREMGQRMINDAEFNGLLRQETVTIAKFVEGLTENMAPILVAILPDKDKDETRKRALVPLDGLPEGEEKRKKLFIAGVQTAQGGVQVCAVILNTEAWIKRLSPAEGWRAKQGVIPQPSKAPDRQDCLVVTAATIDGRTALAYAPLRHVGRKRKLDPWEVTEWNGWDSGTGGADNLDNLLKYFFAGYFMGMKGTANK